MVTSWGLRGPAHAFPPLGHQVWGVGNIPSCPPPAALRRLPATIRPPMTLSGRSEDELVERVLPFRTFSNLMQWGFFF